MSSVVENIRGKIKRRFSHKDPNPDFDDPEASADEETSTYVNKEVEDAEKEGDKYPLGRPNSFLNRMISHGNKKTEDELARDNAEYERREAAKRQAASGGQFTADHSSVPATNAPVTNAPTTTTV